MRLTLRTMLAYLDDILEPDDTQDIGKKIEESEFASNLVHRTRDCMRRLRLGVPALIGRGLGHDPNSVAEYLDNTLSDERVGEFEKVCLESDVHLAEVASCHQILTIVLGEPADIDPEMRRRMYQVAAHVDAPPIQSDAIRPAGHATPPPMKVTTRRAKPEVPDYLRESRSRLWPVAALVLVSALLTCGALLVFGPAEWRRPVAALFARQENAEEPVAAANATANSDEPAAREPETDTPSADESTASTAGENNDQATDKSGQPTPLVPPKNVVDADDAGAPPAPEPGLDPNPKDEDKAATVAPTPIPSTAGKTEANRPPLPGSIKPEPPAEDNPLIASPPPELAAKAAAADTDNAADRPEEAAESVGRYTSKREVLLRLPSAKADAGAGGKPGRPPDDVDSRSGDWKRLPAMSPLAQGDRLLSLPLFKPTVSLSTSVTIQAEGPALFELVGWTDRDVPIIDVKFGRFTISTVGKAGNSLQVQVRPPERRQDGALAAQRANRRDGVPPELDFVLTFVDAESTLALEVRRDLQPGKDPDAGPAPLAAEVYATSGLIRVRSANAAAAELQAPARKALTATTPEPDSNEFPKWVTSDTLTDIDHQATASIERDLPADKPTLLVLKELYGNRRREVRSLATRSAAYLGDFEPSVAALNDPQEKILWSSYIEELRAAVARGPETAAQVRAAFEKQRNPDAGALFRMLWGYGNEDLKGGQDARLVEGLDNSSLDFRVLSFWNLQNLTGSTSGYHPGEPIAKRRTAVNAWKEKLRQGKIVARSPSSSVKAKPSAGKAADKGQP